MKIPIHKRVFSRLAMPGLIGALALFGAQVAFATDVTPVFKDGNPTCKALAPAGVTWFELKVEPVADGTFTDGTLSVTLAVDETAKEFDWTSNIGVDAVFVKGGSGGNLYTYDPPPPEATSDTDLHAPDDCGGGTRRCGLSHVSFCYDIVPKVSVLKGGDLLSKVGDEVTYDFTITNDEDIKLDLVSVSDTLLGDLTAAAQAASPSCSTLAVGASCTFSVPRAVSGTDPDPLKNMVTVTYEATLPDDSTQTVTGTHDHSVDLFHPSVLVDKECTTAQVTAGDNAVFSIKITNNATDDPAGPSLVLVSNTDPDNPDVATCDEVGGVGSTLAQGASCSYTVSIPTTEAGPLRNTVEVHYNPDGFTNDISDTDTDTCDVVALPTTTTTVPPTTTTTEPPTTTTTVPPTTTTTVPPTTTTTVPPSPPPPSPPPPSPPPPSPPPGVTCNGRPATIVGNNNNNTISGTPGSDVIHGRGGHDVIKGLGGNDHICGGPGNDQLFGNQGKDQLFGEDGNDRLKGGTDNDRLFGQAGNDAMDGETGNDDNCNGGIGTDTATNCEQTQGVP